jgi:mRNA interferase HigB
MRVISRKKLRTFGKTHAKANDGLNAWYATVGKTQFADLDELKQAFPQVDYVKPFHVFNIGRGYRLIAAIHFNRQIVFIRHVMTHAEYDRGKWKVK